ncbi:heterokaryon incompatibility protein-domain-containing protein [Paraphoma chrysanthemicola]|uniref:Heterokaryon incompatibility protein-domain-containing protein n=1 Tax=Paraphoma chrysanthemicola TaxID=798071 RepID=A0A8K0QV54_9PLEO|nr:heterokaryon incompatibility protein-domain-containing protein [Paraphoma chrysanthemicola]
MLLQIIPSSADDEGQQTPIQWLTQSVTLSLQKWGGGMYVIVNAQSPQFYGELSISHYLVDRDAIFASPKIRYNVPYRAVDNLGQIKSWLQGCLSSHNTCRSWCSSIGSRRKLPTRVLELVPWGVKLQCNVGNVADFNYVTLSHIWGNDTSQQLRLVKSRFDEFIRSIPTDELPAIFREAIRITRTIGYKYLWIDSLCIIQDSESDWLNEASNMAAVYNNAVCCIAFLFPPSTGFDRTRADPRGKSPCIMRKATTYGFGLSVHPKSTLMSSAMWVQPEGWPWSSRAWTYQEYLLSPRTIFYGHENLMWECAEGFKDELLDDSSLHFTRPESSFGKALLASLMPTMTVRQPNDLVPQAPPWLKSWWALVKRYKSRSLSQLGDSTIAFSAVAEAFQAITGETYLAGAWKESLPFCLLWKRCADDRQGPFNDEDERERFRVEARLLSSLAPSWSWFALPSCEFGAQYDTDPYDDEETTYAAKTINFQWPGHAPNRLPAAAYHGFSGLKVVLELPTCITSFGEREIIVSGPRAIFCPSLEAQIASSQWASCKVAGHCGGTDTSKYVIIRPQSSFHVDCPSDTIQCPESGLLALITTERSITQVRVDPERDNEFVISEMYRFYGLGLARVEADVTYKRYGFWEASVGFRHRMTQSEYRSLSPKNEDGFPSQQAFRAYLDQRMEQHGTFELLQLPTPFLCVEGVKMETLTLV